MYPQGIKSSSNASGAHSHESGWVNEQISGLDYLFFLRELIGRIDDNWQAVLADLQKMHDILINQDNMIVNVTLDAENWQTIQSEIGEFLQIMPSDEVNLPKWEKKGYPQNEG